ncbi:SMP-30/gluconolactonase/LRE family protein [Alteriqipengyuania lutimaris]|uniref:SMP-30/gluconolactonase/LRE family protein n=2 Tax=Alteriqipengyuania lutimaris TaxID=1538146 RepID=A0A395LM11_9SPHN|nr:SMP-30/gluconolactonase/LRE family protein [Alteriqipengyuania lutimaris]RDS75660.1 SMP-30/gluconolactonase/LRE family protein [Alteriqipengyuania lutimaris]
MIWDGWATLGEGPVWDDAAGVLWFVDIKQQTIHRFDPRGGPVLSWDAPAQVGWVFPAQGGGLLAGLQTGLARFDPDDGQFDTVAPVEPDVPTNRLNDATVAKDGSVWFGSMDDNETQASGHFYRWADGRVVRLGIEPAIVTNGPALSPDQTKLYHVDTVGGTVYVSDLKANGPIGSTRVFAKIDPAHGHPDGCTVDSAGNLWLGLWGGWRARLYDPAGIILREVELPVSNVTKVALGGRDMKTAYVTTARAGLSASELERQPFAGALFAFEVDVPGDAMPFARI